MAFATAQEVRTYLNRSPGRNYIHQYDRGLASRTGFFVTIQAPVTLTQARKAVTSIREAQLALVLGKINRPYEIVNLSEKLDPTQAWFGFEIETGLMSRADWNKTINWTWKNIKHMSVDEEGCGNYPGEFTFSPTELSNMEAGKFDALRFLKYLNRSKFVKTSHGSWVGTHVNISTPLYRAAAVDRRDCINYINNLLASLDATQKAEFFGRIPYGLGHIRQNNDGTSRWAEFKLFQSTWDIKQFRKYCHVSARLALLMDFALIHRPSISTVNSRDRANIAEFLRGNLPAEHYFNDEGNS